MTCLLFSIPFLALRPDYDNYVAISESSTHILIYIILDRVSTRVEELQNGAISDVSQVELEALRMEANTWGLLQALMPCVDTSFPFVPS